jgi:hypothetical protein
MGTVLGKGWIVFDKNEAFFELDFDVNQLEFGDTVYLLLESALSA